MPVAITCCFLLILLGGGKLFAQPTHELAHNVHLLSSFVPDNISTGYNDVWGYEYDGLEFAVLGGEEGVFIVDVTDPLNPIEVERYLGEFTTWRDMKSFGDYLYVVLDRGPISSHGELWVIDLKLVGTQNQSLVRKLKLPFGNGYFHNCFVDVESKLLWLIGVDDHQASAFAYDLNTPLNPAFVTEIGNTYWHDAYVRSPYIYGCSFFEGELQIYDIHEVQDSKLVSKTRYTSGESHAVWLSDDGNTLVMADETRDGYVTFWDVTSVDAPELVSRYFVGPNCVPHNVMFSDTLVYVSAYYDGLKVLNISDLSHPVEVAKYDTYPEDNYTREGPWQGAWGVYSNLPSGNILVSDKTHGLFVLDVLPDLKTVYVHATVTTPSGSKLSQVRMDVVAPQGIGNTVNTSGIDGTVLKRVPKEELTLRFQHDAYQAVEMEVDLTTGADTVFLDIELPQFGLNVLEVSLVDEFDNRVQGARVTVESMQTQEKLFLTTEASGSIDVHLADGEYKVSTSNPCDFVSDTLVVSFSEANDSVSVELPYVSSCYETFETISYKNWSYSPFSQRDVDNSIFWFIRTLDFLGVESEGSVGGVPYPNVNVGMGLVGDGQVVFESPILRAVETPFNTIRFKYLFKQYAEDCQFLVQISQDGAQTWETVWMGDTTSGKVLRTVEIDLDQSLQSTSVAVRFLCRDSRNGAFNPMFDDPSIVVLDDVEITYTEGNTKGNETHKVLLVPNPVSNEARIEIEDDVSDIVLIQIYNASGQRLLERDFGETNSSLSTALLFSTREFDSGMYFLKVQTRSRSYTVPFLVQR